MISDHTGSDRNGDGYDSPAIWNDFISNNGVQNNVMGFSFDLQNFSMTSYNTANAPTDSLLHGPMGNVTQVKWTSGTSMTLNTSQNPTVKGIIYKTGSSNTGTTGVLCAYARVGCGRVVGIADSSPTDDGTGNPNATLYNGYTLDASGNHRRLLMNAMIWLASNSCATGVAILGETGVIEAFPNPASHLLTLQVSNSSQDPSSLQLYNGNGQRMNVAFQYDRSANKDIFTLNCGELEPGMYFYQITTEGRTKRGKVTVTR